MMGCRQWLVLIAALMCTSAEALDELGITGPVHDAAPYYRQFIIKSQSNSQPLKGIAQPGQSKAQAYLDRIYNYDSGLTAGTFKRYHHGLNTTYAYQTPICLIADDKLSRKWLKEKHAALIKLNAVCYLIRYQMGGAASLKQAYPKLGIYTINPKYLIDLARVPHYPAVISKKGVEQ